MEVYFKEFISKEASLEKLIDDLDGIVQGADDLAKSIAVNLADQSRKEFASRLQQLKERCRRVHRDIVSHAKATDRIVRKNPYSFIGAAVILGMFVGTRLAARK